MGLITAIVAVVGLVAGGTVVTVKVLGSGSTLSSRSSGTLTPAGSTTPSPSSTGQSPPVSVGMLTSVQLTNTLLPVNTIGAAAVSLGSGTSLSSLQSICGGTDQGDRATAYETIKNQQSGTVLDETLVSWVSASDAAQAITADRQGVDQSGTCSYSTSGDTYSFSYDYPGVAPADCTDPGQFFATNAEVSSQTSSFTPYYGYEVEAACGNITISVIVMSEIAGSVSQQAADGDLTNAISRVNSVT